MAYLAQKPLNVPQIDYGENFQEGIDAQEALIDRLQEASLALSGDEVEGGLLSFSVGDGYAYYLVVKDKPLTLQHVPVFDGYQAPAALLRGLRRADVLARIERERSLVGLFGLR